MTVTASGGQENASPDVTITVTNTPDATVTTALSGTYTRAIGLVPVIGQAKLFVPQQEGVVWSTDTSGIGAPVRYLMISGIVVGTSTNRQGLLAVAPAPDYATSGVLYALVTASANAIELRRYGRGANGLGDPASADVIAWIAFPTSNRKIGGWIGFGPDGFLYLTTGPLSHHRQRRAAQTNASLLGKVLRIDIARDDFPADADRDHAIPPSNPLVGGANAAEVYAVGFANPKSAGFDGTSLYFGDQTDSFDPLASYLYLIRPQDAGSTYAEFGVNGDICQVLTVGGQLVTPGQIVAGFAYRGPIPERPADTCSTATPTTAAASGTTVQTPACCTMFYQSDATMAAVV